jgi:hypothetical protein
MTPAPPIVLRVLHRAVEATLYHRAASVIVWPWHARFPSPTIWHYWYPQLFCAYGTHKFPIRIPQSAPSDLLCDGLHVPRLFS